MGREHASREKKLPMVIFLIFVHKNVYKIGFQEIKIAVKGILSYGPFFHFLVVKGGF